MAKIGYIMTAPGYNDYEADVKKQIANIHLAHPECRQHRTDARTYKRSARAEEDEGGCGMKKIIFLHGFFASGSCAPAQTIKEALEGKVEVLTPDLPMNPFEVKRIVLTGTQYPNCIRATAVDAMSLDYEGVLCTDACSAAFTEVAAANIYDLEHMGIECISLKEIIPSAVS